VPTIAENFANWNDPSRWIDDGNEWSQAWGSPATMWFGSILPRIAANLPAASLLEIACGHGRVTEYLLPHCERYVGVDLAPDCVATCERRFAGVAKASFRQVDGRTLAGIGDGSIDFAISWDSLVHAEQEAIEGYVRELMRVLRPGGTAFLHHSNLHDHVGADGVLSVENPHWRATSVSAALVRDWAARHGAQCLAQELVQWGTTAWNDCFTLLRRPLPGNGVVATRIVRHPGFDMELGFFRMVDATWRHSLAVVRGPQQPGSAAP
jgi:SAM-dependent methyltransferase